EIDVSEALAHQVAHDELVQPRLKESALDDVNRRDLAPLRCGGVEAHDAALILAIYLVHEHEYGSRREGLALPVALDAGLVQDACENRLREGALQSRLRAPCEDDGVIVADTRLNQLLQALTESEHRHEHAHDRRDADHRDGRSAEPLGNAADSGEGENPCMP